MKEKVKKLTKKSHLVFCVSGIIFPNTFVMFLHKPTLKHIFLACFSDLWLYDLIHAMDFMLICSDVVK